ncbi:sugar ABC transporter permease YjfF [Pseudoxanthomonas broegbernensis]|uniref:Sugar ABC transporter permease YjfF n=1 Tax=Pseudoxanthomonas broegbernensis TaxID=83619 RepID=A0A7V8GM57_9GAMM|nr:galactofuranose ABC transporter, permease protein YjfF [Pseudoxanthomonas broegbernensis]KAF1686174.1 sugar ABC transporter permease YjfF [Pseudoxanthomonas broegbernensis]MBB6063880.1 simple sugar transport system permease protein [Pseudoxanthomonas broegbernensis]
MSAAPPGAVAWTGMRRRLRDPGVLSLAVTVSLFVAMSAAGGGLYDGFLAPQVFLNLLIDNAFLLIVAVGMTFVILTGGIDLSVGAVIAFSTVLLASLVERHGWHPLAAIALVLALGTAFGALMGMLVQRYRLQPFVVTLAGMFLARGAATLVSVDSIGIGHGFHVAVASLRIPLGGGASLSAGAAVALAVVAGGALLAGATRFGRTVYAIGGSEQSAELMGLPVAATLVRVYALSGFCSALAGVVYTFYMLSGYSLHAMGLELDAIAAVVIGGTLLAGGRGYVLGTLFGVLVLGLIQTLIVFDGTLSSWWTRIAIGVLLLAFCLLQRLLARRERVAGG